MAWRSLLLLLLVLTSRVVKAGEQTSAGGIILLHAERASIRALALATFSLKMVRLDTASFEFARIRFASCQIVADYIADELCADYAGPVSKCVSEHELTRNFCLMNV